MAASLGAKTFFLPRLPLHEIGQWVDFGCADGALLEALFKVTAKIGPYMQTPEYIGVDASLEQRKAAVVRLRSAILEGVWDLTPDLKSAGTVAPPWGKRAAVFSSVLHEVASEMGREGFAAWWQDEVEDGIAPDYIVIRDFGVGHGARYQMTPAEWIDRVVADPVLANQLAEVEDRYGSRWTLSAFVHFLLKYPYRDNWERELAENYLALSHQDLTAILSRSGLYHPVHVSHTKPPHFVSRVREDFGIDAGSLPFTHIEYILKRNPARWSPGA